MWGGVFRGLRLCGYGIRGRSGILGFCIANGFSVFLAFFRLAGLWLIDMGFSHRSFWFTLGSIIMINGRIDARSCDFLSKNAASTDHSCPSIILFPLVFTSPHQSYN